MKVWTIRTKEEVAVLEREGYLQTDPNKIDLDFKAPYLWMSRQLSKKVPQPLGVQYPIWVWQQWQSNERKKPDLRANCLLPKDTLGARLELEMPADLVLLSDFDAWHCVLNNTYCSMSDTDYEWFERLSEQKTTEELEKIKKASWTRIFDLQPSSDSIQGVTWVLKKEYVQAITYFKAR